MIRDDLKFAVRGLRRDPLYAAAIIGTLTLTLGASTAVFSIVNGVLLRPLPYSDPGRVVSIREVVTQRAHEYPTLPANARHFDEWRHRASSFESMAALDWRTMAISGAGESFQATVLRASGTLFDVLRVPVALGRPLTRADERLDQARVVVISHALWYERLNGDPSVLGRNLALGGTDHTIVGVLPRRFDVPAFDALGGSATLRSKVSAIVPFRLNLPDIGWMGSFNYPVIARLHGGVAMEQARAEMDVLQQSVAATTRRDAGVDVDLRAHITPLAEVVTGRPRPALLLLLGAIGGVVALACANLANLAMTRTLSRLRDSAVRTALGASRAGLVRGIIVEQVVLAAAGGVLGIAFARAALQVFVTTAPIDLPRINDVVIDRRVLAFAAVSALAAGLAVALVPAWRVARQDLQSVLRAGGHGSTDRGGVRARGLLLAAQVALSVALLAVTGLFVTSFMRLVAIDPGFTSAGVVTAEVAPIAARYPDVAARAALYDRIIARVRRLPGIASVAFTSALPLTGETWVDAIGRADDSRPDTPPPNANYRFVGPDYFRVLSIPILKGRTLLERDRSSATTPAVISARAAQTLWAGEDPVGKRFTRGDPSVRFEVVGVVVDGRPTALDSESPLMVYVPYWFNNEGKSLLVAQTAGDEAAAIRAVRAAIREVDPELAIGATGPLRDVVDAALEGRRYQAMLFVAFGGVALMIATTGVYAITTYGVSLRRREMNIRVALGAPVRSLFTLVLRQSVLPLAMGVTLGIAAAFSIGTIVSGVFNEVQAGDPVVTGVAAAIVAVAGMIAATAAARQGLRIDPVEALRGE